jgi:hypothetical protein
MGGQLPFLRHSRNARSEEKPAISGAAVWNATCFMYERHDWNVTTIGTGMRGEDESIRFKIA